MSCRDRSGSSSTSRMRMGAPLKLRAAVTALLAQDLAGPGVHLELHDPAVRELPLNDIVWLSARIAHRGVELAAGIALGDHRQDAGERHLPSRLVAFAAPFL